jgi:hypothetical protein
MKMITGVPLEVGLVLEAWWACVYTPFLWLYCPGGIVARLGAQIELVQKQLVIRTPPRAMR